jgi:conjugal transfer pilus assembly protein TraW
MKRSHLQWGVFLFLTALLWSQGRLPGYFILAWCGISGFALYMERLTLEKVQFLFSLYAVGCVLFSAGSSPWLYCVAFLLHRLVFILFYKRVLCHLFLILIFSSSTALHAKDLGVYGETFPIAEENLLEVIRKKLANMEADGSLAQVQKKIAQKAREKILKPSPLKGLIKTKTPRHWTYDPSMTIESNIKDHKGNFIASKGDVINPLDRVSWGAPLLFLDGDDHEQVAWAKTQHVLSKWVLVKGSPVDLEEKLKHPVYFDQAGVLVNKFGIQQVPCRISQKDRKLLVEELIPLKKEQTK